jgi:L-fuconolactonase
MGTGMEIIDAQIHDPEVDLPGDDEIRLRFITELVLAAMDAVGVDIGMAHEIEPGWCRYACAHHPDRFVGVSGLASLSRTDDAAFVADAASAPWIVGLRLTYTSRRLPPGVTATIPGRRASAVLPQLAELREGRYRGLLDAAARHRMPVAVPAGRLISQGGRGDLERLFDLHGDVCFIIDHLGLLQPPSAPAADDPFELLPEVLALARHDNVVVKLTGAPTLSRLPFPFGDLWPHLHKLLAAFGVHRVMWGSDYTRLRMAAGTLDLAPRSRWLASYAESVGFLLETTEISEADKQMVLAGAARRIFP